MVVIRIIAGCVRAGLAALSAAILCAAAAHAQEPAPGPETPQTIGVFGDSLADGLWIGLRWAFRRDPRVAEVEQLSEVSTGLANWVYRDLSVKTADQLSRARYDVAVVMVGSNDMQGIRDEAGGVHAFRSPSWERIYRARIDDILTQLMDHGAQVYWVGLPVMRSARYDANTQYLNALFQEHAEAAGAVYVDTRAVSAAADGRYSGYLPDAAGVDRLMRADDGIHFTLPGYRRLAEPVAAAIEYGWANPQSARAAEAEPFSMLDQLEIMVDGEPWVCRRPEGWMFPDFGASDPDPAR
ncbi:MAG: SGNH/GDSL hydrolase family protein [Oceanicaulis sp.]